MENESILKLKAASIELEVVTQHSNSHEPFIQIDLKKRVLIANHTISYFENGFSSNSYRYVTASQQE